MLAFHNSPAIKEKYLARVRAHRAADEIVKGYYWKECDGWFRGCAVGCTLHSSDHSAYETELGIPVQLAFLEDIIFENLPQELALDWPERFLDAAKPGADLSLVVNRWLVWVLTDSEHGVIRFAGNCPQVLAAIQNIAALHNRVISGKSVVVEEWTAASCAVEAAEAVLECGLAAAVLECGWGAECDVEGLRVARVAYWAAETASERGASISAEWAAIAASEREAYISFADKLVELIEAA